ncbi:MAG TPA: S-adenosylmethionine decarboxylase [Streptosporangiaceae bacterium]|jgi:S-adenosylmethionine decarboxylase|nr:S-adenosylmethionine decarboxylase [Streptosporangiaceae bacterium]
MPGKGALSAQTVPPRPGIPAPKMLHAIDATFPADSPAADLAQLTDAATAAVRAGNGHVLDTSHVIFPNGAITLVLILAESHLSVHTWPEEKLIAVDLFSCGAIDAATVTGELIRELALADVSVHRLPRGPQPLAI